MADLKRLFRRAMTFVALLGLVVAQPVAAQQGGEPPREARFAFVIGNDGYDGAPLATAANDAALVADTLKTAGFDVTGARNLDQETLRASYREFLEKVAAAGDGAVAAIYLSGYGVQSEGENYLIPPGARVAREADLALNAVRISDMTRGLGGLPARARIIMLDLAHAGPFVREGQPLAPGLALVEPEEGTLIAFNAAPGSVAPVAKPPYGPYAQALAEMMREAGLPVNDVFARVRTRVAELTRGAQAPWHVSRAPDDLILLERGPDAPPPAVTSADLQARRAAPLNQMGPAEAYAAAVARDTIAGYEAFLAVHPQSPYARNVRNMLAARREAVTWRRTTSVNTPNAYWSYLQRYPKGPHAADARRRLSRLQAALEPPPSFDVVDYDVAPPSEEEIVYFNDSSPGFVAFEAPIDEYVPPPPRWWRPPPPPVFEEDEYYFLPAPVEVVETPVWVSRPRYIAAPPPPEWREPPREGVRVNPYVAIPAALAAGIVAGKIISDRRDRNRRPDAGPGRPPRQPFLPPVSATANDLRGVDRRGPQGGP
ncbi:MAG TPA: caspase family protein, partial [Beijerinckiaceae bacterium]